MKYFGGCDVGSTYTKAVILDENGKIIADTTLMSKINSEQSATIAMAEVCQKAGLKSSKDLEYLIGTGYGRNKVPFADENISEISCHAMVTPVLVLPERAAAMTRPCSTATSRRPDTPNSRSSTTATIQPAICLNSTK